MLKPGTAYLVCIYDHTGKLIKRRIALNWSDAIDFVDGYAKKLGATAINTNSNCSGVITNNSANFGTYNIANIAVV